MIFLILAALLSPSFSGAGELVCRDSRGLEIRGNVSSGTGSALFGDLTFHQGSGASPVLASISRKDVVGYWNHRGALLILALDPLSLQTGLELNARCPIRTAAKECPSKVGTFLLNLKDSAGKRLIRKAGTSIRCVHTQ